MTIFKDSSLPSSVERGASGGSRFLTDVIPSLNGVETRAIKWQDSRAEYQISFSYDAVTFKTVTSHFYNMRGRAHSFPFYDWSDHDIGDIATLNQFVNFAIGDGATQSFDIYKPYVVDSFIYQRRIEKPIVAGTRVYINNSEIFSGFTVNRNGGSLDFTSPPANLDDIGIACQFHVPVRYDSDQNSVSMITTQFGNVPSITLLEVKGESLS